MLESVRIADRNHELSRAERTRVAKLHGLEIRRSDAHHRDIRVGILADQIGRALPPIGKRHRDVVRVLDDVAVGEEEAVVCEDEARAGAGLSA